jgi:hypothetical protein
LPFKHIAVDPNRLDAARVIDLGAVHQIAYGINFQRASGARSSAILCDSLRGSSFFNRQPK